MKRIIIVSAVLLFLSVNMSIAQWEPDVRLTNSIANSNTRPSNCIAAVGNTVHIVWYDDRDGNRDIYYKQSTDGGINWGADTRLTSNSSSSSYPSIAISGNNVHVVWQDNRDGNQEIYYKRSSDGGINWGANTRLTNNTFSSETPSISVSGSNVHVVWVDNRDGNYEIYYKLSIDGGINWGTDIRLTNNTYSSLSPSIAVTVSLVYVVWYDERDGNREIYYKRSADGGISWGAETRITYGIYASEFPVIGVSSTFVHVVWNDSRDGNSEIYYKRSTDGGINWSADTRLTNNSAYSLYSSISVSGSNVHIVWNDFRDGNFPYSGEIYYKHSVDNGLNWDIDTRLTNDSADSFYPSIAVSGTKVHVVWQDKRDGNDEIYFKRNPTGQVGIKNISTGIPTAFSLEQNYPNPFNPKTVIRFDVMRSPTGAIVDDKVVLKVYDVMGREVETLVNEKLAPGTYETTFDGSKLNSGVYFYRLQTERFTETKRMTLIK